MVKVVSVPVGSRDLFSDNELSGWTDGVAYDCGPPPFQAPKLPPRKPSNPQKKRAPVIPAQHVAVGKPARVVRL